MRLFLLSCICAAVSLLGIPAHADVSLKPSQTLQFVAETAIGAGGADLALCAVIETQSSLGINFWRDARGYGLATDTCEATHYTPLTATEFVQAQIDEMIASDVPRQPVLSTEQKLTGFWGWIFVTGGLPVSLGSLVIGRWRSHSDTNGAQSLFATRATQVMGMVAVAGGRMSDAKLESIREILADVTGHEFPSETLANIILAIKMPKTSGDFQRLGLGLSQDNRELLLRAVLLSVKSDGEVQPAQHRFLAALYPALGVTSKQFNSIVSSTFKSRQTPQAA